MEVEQNTEVLSYLRRPELQVDDWSKSYSTLIIPMWELNLED